MSRTRTTRRGYTIVEVMMALAIFSISATGVVAMQKATLVGNLKARNLATATQVSQAWMSRLRVDAQQWTSEDGVENTNWLVGATDGNAGLWFRPAISEAMAASPESDIRGNDVFDGLGVGFCSNVRLTQIDDDMIRAEVRVMWLRHQGGGTADDQPLCGTNQAFLQTVGGLHEDRYRFVYTTSAVFRNGG